METIIASQILLASKRNDIENLRPDSKISVFHGTIVNQLKDL